MALEPFLLQILWSSVSRDLPWNTKHSFRLFLCRWACTCSSCFFCQMQKKGEGLTTWQNICYANLHGCRLTKRCTSHLFAEVIKCWCLSFCCSFLVTDHVRKENGICGVKFGSERLLCNVFTWIHVWYGVLLWKKLRQSQFKRRNRVATFQANK